MLPASGTFARTGEIVSSSKISFAVFRISAQSLKISSLVVLGSKFKGKGKFFSLSYDFLLKIVATHLVEVTVKRITYFPCKAAGTQCTRPLEFIFFNKRSVKLFSPRRRNTTSPKCLVAGISKRASAKTSASNFCASLTP